MKLFLNRLLILYFGILSVSKGFAVEHGIDKDIAPVRAAFHQHYAPLWDRGLIRPFNEPTIVDHGQRTKQVVVLVHGLTDSPYFMRDLGKFFYEQGFNVVIPLLPGHGLKNPGSIKKVTYREWIEETEFAVETASQLGDVISIGGLSTGGVLAVYMAHQNPQKIGGGIFLFSAALGLGKWQEALLRYAPIVKFFSWGRDLYLRYIKRVHEEVDGIGDNPYRYSKVYYEGGRQLVLLIDKLRSFYPDNVSRYRDIKQPLFAAHSAVDTTADINEIEQLVTHVKDQNKTMFFRMKADLQIGHSSVTLARDIVVQQHHQLLLLEQKNPQFQAMTSQLMRFIKIYLS